MSQTTAFDNRAMDVSTFAALREAYAAVRDETERRAAPLGPEDQTAQSMPDASPTKWHRAHTSWFFETFVLQPHLPGYRPFDPAYGYLFNSYYNAIGEQYPRGQRGLVTRPDVAEVASYRAHVDAAMDRLLQEYDEGAGAIEQLVVLGLNHEQQHQELMLTDALHLLSHSPLDPVYDRNHAPPRTRTAARTMRPHPGGIAEVGHRAEGFAFDNEGPAHRVLLAPHALSSQLVTCGEYLQFVEDGGYARVALWLDAGLAWLGETGATLPLYWRREPDGSYTRFGLQGRAPLREDDPVTHLSFYEADAYARWAGARLPSEAEWESAAPEPGSAADTDFFGAAWQWTRSDYAGYPGYAPPEGAVGEYNGKFMCGQFVLRGSSAFTPEGHARRTYRNFFPPAARWQCTGLRLARDA